MLCTQILNGMVRAAKVLTLTPGKDYDVVAISFDARETPKRRPQKKAVYMRDYGHPETANGWHFLTGDLDRIKSVTDAVGFRYKWDVHTGAVRARQRDLCADAGRASFRNISTGSSIRRRTCGWVWWKLRRTRSAARWIRFCCSAITSIRRRRSTRFIALDLLRVAGAATLLALGGFVFIMLRREQAERECEPSNRLCR